MHMFVWEDIKYIILKSIYNPQDLLSINAGDIKGQFCIKLKIISMVEYIY